MLCVRLIIIAALPHIGCQMLHKAAASGSRQEVIELLDGGADVNAPFAGQKMLFAPLHLAALQGHTNIIALLLERGANIDARDSQGSSALHHAAGRGLVDAASVLLKHRASLAAEDANGKTALDVARSAGHANVAELQNRPQLLCCVWCPRGALFMLSGIHAVRAPDHHCRIAAHRLPNAP